MHWRLSQAFWNRPGDDVMRDLTFPEEHVTTPRWEGGFRRFRSPNGICLEKTRQAREGRQEAEVRP